MAFGCLGAVNVSIVSQSFFVVNCVTLYWAAKTSESHWKAREPPFSNSTALKAQKDSENALALSDANLLHNS